MKKMVLISFMAAALWLFTAPAHAEQNTMGAPDSSGRVVEKPDANTLDHGAPNDPTPGRMAPDSSGRAVEKPDANTLDHGAPNDPDSVRDVPDSDGRVVEPDNSGRNERDADGSTLTPMDQSQSKEDIELTQNIRREVTASDTLSTMAQNVKIITVDGVVTLRGPVESETERQQIAALAERIAGNGKVKNQLEVAR